MSDRENVSSEEVIEILGSDAEWSKWLFKFKQFDQLVRNLNKATRIVLNKFSR